MDARSWTGQYLVAVAVFTAVDLVWLGVVADRLYDDLLGDLLADEPNVLAALAFYAVFVAGLVHFVVRPALAAGSLRKAVLEGAFFGFVAYAAWDLTSLAVIDGFPAAVVPVDLAWGAVLAASVCAATYGIWVRLSRDDERSPRRR